MFKKYLLLPSSALKTKDRGSMFLQNVVLIYQTACHHITGDSKLHSHHCENLKFHIDTESLHK
jgi:hypothetical protein